MTEFCCQRAEKARLLLFVLTGPLMSHEPTSHWDKIFMLHLHHQLLVVAAYNHTGAPVRVGT